ncbi:fumarylacetoacetate hydrolase family protein [Pseudonocardia kujensis]|uniref:fumarylacetoacetate hydrolase family protein n=1 Tax=Pseudonocardia kujensis TaxID=1128675 RepID=UPI001E2DD7F5|nr:fumarylacetoacetate hydrolase family protein [Pseudonocardia kujensis]MCE0765544.1 fumarylacetoacetate hydrolase family protein [Pseudonocardia kujensis]
MRLARFRTAAGLPAFGVVDGDEVVRLDRRVPSFESLLAAPVAPEPGDERASGVSWEPPIGEHAKVICVGMNYAAHAVESGREVLEQPTLFARFPDSFVGAGTPVVRPAVADSLDWEGEAAIVIGRGGRHLTEDEAWEHVAGVTAMAENSVRTWQLHSTQATAGKNFAGSGAIGPWLTTLDEIGRGPWTVTTRLNGEQVQHDSTDHLVFAVPRLLAYVSAFTPLRPGDVIATGTPRGIGLRRDPPRFLRPGDEVEVEVSGVGVLRNGVVDELVTTGRTG